MSLQSLSGELILMILEELDSVSLAQCCKASYRIRDIVTGCTPLRFLYELEICGMKNGPPNTYPLRVRLEQLMSFKEGWPTLSWSSEYCLTLSSPTIIGVSGGHLFQAGSNVLDDGLFRWTLRLYELPSYRIGRADTSLHQCKIDIPIEIRRIAIDPSQNLVVLSQLNLFSNNTMVSVRLHFLDLTTFQQHQGGASDATFVLPTSCMDQNSMDGRVWNPHLEVCGSRIGVTILFDLGNGHSSAHLVIVDWHTGRSVTCALNVMSFHFIDQFHVLVAGQSLVPDFSSSLRPSSSFKCIHRLSVYDVSDINMSSIPCIRTFNIPETWTNIASMTICRNLSPRFEGEIPSGSSFYSDPSGRITVVAVKFENTTLQKIHPDQVVVVFNQSVLMAGPSDAKDVPWIEWRDECLVHTLPSGAHCLQVAGRRLIYLQNTINHGASGGPSSSLCVMDFNHYVPSFFRSVAPTSLPAQIWDNGRPIRTIAKPHHVLPYTMTSMNAYSTTAWIQVTEDNIVFFEEDEGQTHVKILTFGSDISVDNLPA